MVIAARIPTQCWVMDWDIFYMPGTQASLGSRTHWGSLRLSLCEDYFSHSQMFSFELLSSVCLRLRADSGHYKALNTPRTSVFSDTKTIYARVFHGDWGPVKSVCASQRCNDQSLPVTKVLFLDHLYFYTYSRTVWWFLSFITVLLTFYSNKTWCPLGTLFNYRLTSCIFDVFILLSSMLVNIWQLALWKNLCVYITHKLLI